MSNDNKISIQQLEEISIKKKYVTRGVTFAKKMWRDGYNKALDDFITAAKIILQNEKNN